MGDYPESKRLAAAAEQTQVIGEFIDWLQGQGVQLMIYREDLEDHRPTDPECEVSFNSDDVRPCDQVRDNGDGDHVKPRAWWRRHCLHWQDTEHPAEGDGKEGTCCRCGKEREHVITTRGWVHEQRGAEQLLADWAGIDLKKVEAERRRMLASLPAAGSGAEDG